MCGAELGVEVAGCFEEGGLDALFGEEEGEDEAGWARSDDEDLWS